MLEENNDSLYLRNMLGQFDSYYLFVYDCAIAIQPRVCTLLNHLVATLKFSLRLRVHSSSLWQLHNVVLITSSFAMEIKRATMSFVLTSICCYICFFFTLQSLKFPLKFEILVVFFL